MSSVNLKNLDMLCSRADLAELPAGKVLINTINAHSFNVAQRDELFAEALTRGGYLIPDGASIVKACRWKKAKCQPKERISGWDLFEFEMQRLAKENEEEDLANTTKWQTEPSGASGQEATGERRKKVMFMGSSEKVLNLIRERAAKDYPGLEIVTYSPPYKPEFSDADNRAIIAAINAAQPNLLWIGMTAPKQEKWAYVHWEELQISCHVGTIGAVFDFYAGTVKRAPLWWQRHSLEWLYRLLREPRRMWRRYVIGNVKFLWTVARS
ncbi:MAG: WecB/TagA/CpsF family glycosyltransferase [Bacteroidales bacterium]|nr:WecB/TagA/CpsF family glycosyltransferase [Candidatus Physcousia equi]